MVPHYSGRPRDLSPETPRFCCRLGGRGLFRPCSSPTGQPCLRALTTSPPPCPGCESPACHSAVCPAGAQHLLRGPRRTAPATRRAQALPTAGRKGAQRGALAKVTEREGRAGHAAWASWPPLPTVAQSLPCDSQEGNSWSGTGLALLLGQPGAGALVAKGRKGPPGRQEATRGALPAGAE